MHVRLVRKSDLRPTRIRGVVGQKWRTSGYHWRLLVVGVASSGGNDIPCPSHSRVNSGSQLRSRRKASQSQDMKVAASDHILPAQQYPREPTQQSGLRVCAWFV